MAPAASRVAAGTGVGWIVGDVVKLPVLGVQVSQRVRGD
jgi:hypothetical protein